MPQIKGILFWEDRNSGRPSITASILLYSTEKVSQVDGFVGQKENRDHHSSPPPLSIIVRWWQAQNRPWQTKGLRAPLTYPVLMVLSPPAATITSGFTFWLMLFQTFLAPCAPTFCHTSHYECIFASRKAGGKIVLSGWQLSEGYIIKGTNHRCPAIIARWMHLSGDRGSSGSWGRREGDSGGTAQLAFSVSSAPHHHPRFLPPASLSPLMLATSARLNLDLQRRQFLWPRQHD